MLNVDALADYTRGRLASDDQETEVVLARSLAAVRRWCGWHVTPVTAQSLTIDGPGGQLLRLPTLCVVELTSITEDGLDVDLESLQWSLAGLVRKDSGAAWTSRFGGIAVEMSHGFTDQQVPDFESAVLSVADRMSQTTEGTAISVGPFRFSEDKTSGSSFTTVELSILEQYRLERTP